MRLRQRLSLAIGKSWIHTSARLEKLRYGVAVDILSEDLARDPYPTFDAVRELRPVHWSSGPRAYWVTPFELVQELLRDKRFGADVRRYEHRVARIERDLSDEQREVFNNPSMLDLDPPDHTRIRRLAQQGFLHRYVQSLEPSIRRIVDACLDRVANEERFDVMDALARPLPAIVIADMMGLPEADHDQFQRWSEDLIDGTSTNDPERITRAQRSSKALRDYFRDRIRERRGTDGEDLIRQLIRAEEEGDRLTELELYNTCLLLLVAGHETTTRVIGNGLQLLLTHPDQFAWLREHPESIPDAIEEMLRFEPPVQATRRFVTEDLEFHGTRFSRGDLIFVSIAAANRDPAANADPARFDVRREKVQQVSFGYGIHLCLGASLARLEAKVAFEALLARYPQLGLVDAQPAWGGNLFFRGLDRLPVSTTVA
jgi:cytochrome P450